MFDDTDTGVVIADGLCGIRLSRLGQAVGLGYPTLIEVRAGSFAGTVRDETVGDYALFISQLESLSDQLSGTAILSSYEGFSLSLIGDGMGHIAVTVKILVHHPSIRLTFEALIDQTYLPAVHRSLRREFPAPARRR